MLKYATLIKNHLLISAGALLLAVGISLFAEPFQIAPGGISGVAIIISYMMGTPVGILIILLNIPLFLLAFLKLGRYFVFSSLYAMLLSSLLIDVLARVPVFVEEPLLAAVYGGLTIGAGMGLIFMYGSSTGGTDIIVRLLRMRFKGLKLGQITFLLDLLVIAAAAIAFGDINRALYAIITVYVHAIVMDAIIYGMEFSKVAYIISQKSGQISQRIQTELERGVTIFHGEGGYSKQPTNIIMCALKQQQVYQFHNLVQEIDPEAFIIITNAYEVVGYGFKRTGVSDL